MTFLAQIDELVYLAQEIAFRLYDISFDMTAKSKVKDKLTRAEVYQLARDLAVEFLPIHNNHNYRDNRIKDQDDLITKFLYNKDIIYYEGRNLNWIQKQSGDRLFTVTSINFDTKDNARKSIELAKQLVSTGDLSSLDQYHIKFDIDHMEWIYNKWFI